MLADTTQALEVIRDIVAANIDPTLRYSFEPMSARDFSNNYAGDSLYKQDMDFVLFEADVDTTRRAGPSVVSPSRAWGSVTITLHTKNMDDDLTYRRQVEVLSGWFTEKTVLDVRFRTYVPLPTTRVMGFLAFSGVFSFDFDLQPKGI